MAIKEAQAELVFQFNLATITGFLDIRRGFIDQIGRQGDGAIRPISNGWWGQYGGRKWSDMGRWIQNPLLPIIWTSKRIELGAAKWFTMSITSEFKGTVSKYVVWTSTTGLFQGEESFYIIEEGNTNIPAFYGEFAYVQIYVNGTELSRMSIDTNSSTFEVQLQNVDTSTLPGSAGNRTLSLDNPISAIQDISITVKAADPYPVNLYVSDTATSEILIPVVRSKAGASPSFGLFGIDNDPRDGIVDVKIKAMNRQAMIGGNVYIIE